MKMKGKMISSFIFPSNGAPVEWNWRGKTEVLGVKPVPVPLGPPQIPHGLTRDRTRASAVGGRRLSAWAMTRSDFEGYSSVFISMNSVQKCCHSCVLWKERWVGRGNLNRPTRNVINPPSCVSCFCLNGHCLFVIGGKHWTIQRKYIIYRKSLYYLPQYGSNLQFMKRYAAWDSFDDKSNLKKKLERVQKKTERNRTYIKQCCTYV
jgi:hypothetical protein